jgi:hypothetical protein
MSDYRRRTALAGLLYLGMIVFGILAQTLRSGIVVAGDAAATARNISAHGTLFRVSAMSDLIMTVCYFLWGLVLFSLLKKVDRKVALLMAVTNFIGAPIMALNILNQVAAQRILLGADYLKAFSAEQLQALSLFFLDLQNLGYLIAAISYGLYLLPLGYLVLKSGFFPRAFGVLYLIAGSATLIDFATQFLFPRLGALTQNLLYPVALLEISFCLWLLVKAARGAGKAAPLPSN